MRLIDADALEEKAKQYSLGYYEADEWAVPLCEINEAPTIEPKRGKWIPHKQENGKTVLWKCSECGQIIFSETETDRLEFQKWCSRCGARMKGEDDGNK